MRDHKLLTSFSKNQQKKNKEMELFKNLKKEVIPELMVLNLMELKKVLIKIN